MLTRATAGDDIVTANLLGFAARKIAETAVTVTVDSAVLSPIVMMEVARSFQ